jgi:hypothetical protein
MNSKKSQDANTLIIQGLGVVVLITKRPQKCRYCMNEKNSFVIIFMIWISSDW